MGNRLFRSDWRELCAVAVARRGSPGTDYNEVSYHMFCRGPHMGNRLFRSDWRELCAVAVARLGSPGTDYNEVSYHMFCRGHWETDDLGVTGPSRRPTHLLPMPPPPPPLPLSLPLALPLSLPLPLARSFFNLSLLSHAPS